MPPLLSAIIPVYNEEKTIDKILNIIDSIKIDKEIIAIDDCSSDRSRDILEKLNISGLRIISHTKNLGKGAAFKTGLEAAKGDIIIIQDADLEYNPNDYYKLIAPIVNNEADLVLGVRFLKGYKGLFLHKIGNRFLTGLLNILYGVKLNDVYTCYKVAKREIFNKFSLKSTDFSIEQEIIIKAIRNKLRIKEVSIGYHPRNYSEGKKIRLRDGLRAIIQTLRLKLTPLDNEVLRRTL